jgi:hypothetical protein
MKHLLGIILVVGLFLGLSSCYNNDIKKPDKLIPKKKFEKMMIDLYIAQGMSFEQSPDSLRKKITQTDLYYAVLKKYNIPDTVFIRSLIYYSSFPKDYEKMHEQIMNVFKEEEAKYKPNGALNEEEK